MGLDMPLDRDIVEKGDARPPLFLFDCYIFWHSVP